MALTSGRCSRTIRSRFDCELTAVCGDLHDSVGAVGTMAVLVAVAVAVAGMDDSSVLFRSVITAVPALIGVTCPENLALVTGTRKGAGPFGSISKAIVGGLLCAADFRPRGLSNSLVRPACSAVSGGLLRVMQPVAQSPIASCFRPKGNIYVSVK